VKVDDLAARDGLVYVINDPEKSMSHGNVIRTARANSITITGRGDRWPVGIDRTGWLDNPRGKFAHLYSFATCIAEVEVDLESGITNIPTITIAQDCGYPLNPMNVEGQIHRAACAAVQGGLFERVLWDNGQVLNANFLDYWFPLATDVPKVNTIFVETNDPFGPYGAKEAGLAAAMAVASAVSNAIYHATGVCINELPITPDKLAKALEEKNQPK
jgi:4-hydroxybenzoyl-CoA reductase subunit alpha